MPRVIRYNNMAIKIMRDLIMEINLYCNNFKNPIGVSIDKINFSCTVIGIDNFNSLTVMCATDRKKLKNGLYDLWEQAFDKNYGLNFVYRGKKLIEKQVVYWQIALNDSNKKIFSEIAFFETGIMFENSNWIDNPKFDGRVLEFYLKFKVKEGFKNARLYICGLGFYNAKINKLNLDNNFYKPLLTNYNSRDKKNNDVFLYEESNFRTTYYTYDVKSFLNIGENILNVWLDSGYYYNRERSFTHLGEQRVLDFSYGKPKLIFELHLDYENYSDVISSSEKCLVKNLNRFCNLYSGDRIDFNKPEEVYINSEITSDRNVNLISPKTKNDVLDKRINPLSVKKLINGAIRYDFGENHSGGLSFSVIGGKGGKLTIRYSEFINEFGDLGGEIEQSSEYILSGNVDRSEPLFNWYCYRFAEIQCDKEFEIIEIQSFFIHTEIEKTGNFVCSVPLLNEIHNKFVQTALCNLHAGVLSDCPHREKLPYTGDGQIIMDAMLCCFDAESFYRKWLTDILDSQNKYTGFIPYSAPHLGGGGGFAWGNAVCVVPYRLYKLTGDIEILKNAFPAILKWLDYYGSQHDGDFIIKRTDHTWLLGEWLAPEITKVDVQYLSTVCYYQAADIALYFAEVLNESKKDELITLKSRIAKAINDKYYNKEKAIYSKGVQGENILPLYFGFVDKNEREKVLRNIEKNYRQDTDYHLDTGIILTPILINFLTKCGLKDIALKIMLNKTYPSYAYMLDGETTFPEHWSKKWPDYTYGKNNELLVKGGGDVSHCHPMFGSIVSWLYNSIAGLDFLNIGTGKIKFAPKFLESIKSASACKKTPYGEIKTSYENEEGLVINLTVPKGLEIECDFEYGNKSMCLQGSTEKNILPDDGHYSFKLPSGIWKVFSKKD